MKKSLTTVTAILVTILFVTVCPAIAQDHGAPDTLYLWPSELEAGGNDSLFTLEAWIFNDADSVDVQFGFDWDSDLIRLDSVAPSPLALSVYTNFFFFDGNIDISNQNKRAAFSGFSFGHDMFPPGEEPKLLATYYFSVTGWTNESQIAIDSLGFDDGAVPFFLDGFGNSWKPVWYWGDTPLIVRDVNYQEPCCGRYTGGFTGNTDCDTNGNRNLRDVIWLIARAFNLFIVEPCCEENFNVDGDIDGKVNLEDIIRLLDHVYLSKAETAPCQ